MHIPIIIKIFIHANFHVSFSLSFHYNVLFGLITISNTRSERVNENITTCIVLMPVIKYVYMQNFMFIGISVIEILEFNRKKRKKKKKNMAKL